LARDLSNKQIASHLCLSEFTVKNHVHRLLRKLGAPNRWAAVYFVERHFATQEE
jgi:DNA-binding NarL/FixJ family response regulator